MRSAQDRRGGETHTVVRTKLELLYLPHLAVLDARHAGVAARLPHLVWERWGEQRGADVAPLVIPFIATLQETHRSFKDASSDKRYTAQNHKWLFFYFIYLDVLFSL